MSDFTFTFISSDPWNGGHPSGLASITNQNLCPPAFIRNTSVSEKLPHTNHTLLLSFWELILPQKTGSACLRGKSASPALPVMPCFHIAASNLHNLLLPAFPGKSAPLPVRLCTPQILDGFPLNKEFQIGKGVHQGFILSLCLFNFLYHVKRHAG